MSVTFHAGTETIWEPASAVGEIFVAYAHALADLLGQDSGVSIEIPHDTFLIEVPRMEGFVAALLIDYLSARHRLYRMLVDGVLITCMVLLGRAGHPVALDPLDEDQRILAQQVAAQENMMPRQ